jgi:hypothetical protein
MIWIEIRVFQDKKNLRFQHRYPLERQSYYL